MVARCIARRVRACARLGCHSLCRCTRSRAALGTMNEGVCGHEGGGDSPQANHVHFIACTHLGLFLPVCMQRCKGCAACLRARPRPSEAGIQGMRWGPCGACTRDRREHLRVPLRAWTRPLIQSQFATWPLSFRDGPETLTAWHLTARTTRARQSRRQPLCQATRSCAAASCHAGRRAGLGARLCSFALPRSGRA